MLPDERPGRETGAAGVGPTGGAGPASAAAGMAPAAATRPARGHGRPHA